MTPIESLPAKLEPCGDCGMPCKPGEYHPYAACLMFKACHNSETVRANLQALAAQPKEGELLALCRLIVDEAVPATASGQTCFVPRYQLDKLRKLIGQIDSGEG